MKTSLLPNEVVVREGDANLQRGWETAGGKLALTNQRLVFEAHFLNFQRGTTEIPLSDIFDIRLCWTKFLGLIPLFPNSLAVLTSNQEYRMVIHDRDDWASAIRNQIRSQRGEALVMPEIRI